MAHIWIEFQCMSVFRKDTLDLSFSNVSSFRFMPQDQGKEISYYSGEFKHETNTAFEFPD